MRRGSNQRRVAKTTQRYERATRPRAQSFRERIRERGQALSRARLREPSSGRACINTSSRLYCERLEERRLGEPRQSPEERPD